MYIKILFAFALVVNVSQQSFTSPKPRQDEMKNPVNVLGKDLTMYYVALFSKGPNWRTGGEDVLAQRAKENKQLHELVKAGKVVGLVRTTGDENYKLLVFLKTDSKDEAWALVESTLVVKEKMLTPEIYHVWGTRGMGKKLGEPVEGGKKRKEQTYFLSLFTKGKKWTADAPDDSMKAWASRHAAGVLKLRDSGELKFYGAIDDKGPLRVMGIFAGKSLDDVKKKLNSAPMVKGEWFSADAFPCKILDGVLP